MNKKKAFLFDLNGTMIDDMPYHIEAWYHILNSLGANISMERMKEECYGKNDELLERIFPGRYTEDEKRKLSHQKEEQYRAQFKPHLKLIDGLESYLQQAHGKGIKMAIGSAAIMANIDFVLDGMNIRYLIDAIVSADNVIQSKPHPETFLKCAALLNMSPADCVVFEDSPKGVEAAQNAGMDCVVITTLHKGEEFKNFKNVVSIIKDYKEALVQQL